MSENTKKSLNARKPIVDHAQYPRPKKEIRGHVLKSPPSRLASKDLQDSSTVTLPPAGKTIAKEKQKLECRKSRASDGIDVTSCAPHRCQEQGDSDRRSEY
jgi:hypothetical protein